MHFNIQYARCYSDKDAIMFVFCINVFSQTSQFQSSLLPAHHQSVITLHAMMPSQLERVCITSAEKS